MIPIETNIGGIRHMLVSKLQRTSLLSHGGTRKSTQPRVLIGLKLIKMKFSVIKFKTPKSLNKTSSKPKRLSFKCPNKSNNSLKQLSFSNNSSLL